MQTIDVMKQAMEFVKANHSGGPDAFELIDTLDQAIKQEALQAMHDNAQELGLGYEPQVQEFVAHCEAGPEYCQQCCLEDRSLALASAVRYVKNNTPKLVSDEIHMALSTPPATVQPLAILNHAHGVYAFRSVNLQGLPDGEYQVYTTAPAAQKPWVGLTDDLITEIWETHPYFNDFARNIEAKLKALNYPISDN